jgi:hypothetical protein
MCLAARLKIAAEYVEWLRIQKPEKPMQSTDRTKIAGACFAIAQEHHHSIVFLMEHELYASAFALLRVLFDAYVRGEWICTGKLDKQVEDYKLEKSLKIDVLLAEIESEMGTEDKKLSSIKKKYWKEMCSFTHTGFEHVLCWQTPKAIHANYQTKDLFIVLKLAEILGTVAALGIAELASDDVSVRLITDKFETYMSEVEALGGTSLD